MFLVMKIRQLLGKSNVPHLHRNVTETIILQMIAKKNENWTTSDGMKIGQIRKPERFHAKSLVYNGN